MAYCGKCGGELEPNAAFCSKCGFAVNDSNLNPTYSPQTTPSYIPPVKPEVNSTPYLVWSIINTVCCCLPFGIVGIVYSSKVKSAATPEEAKKILDTAKIWCIVGTACGFIAMILYFILVVMGIAADSL